jgi:hypothetical protein
LTSWYLYIILFTNVVLLGGSNACLDCCLVECHIHFCSSHCLCSVSFVTHIVSLGFVCGNDARRQCRPSRQYDFRGLELRFRLSKGEDHPSLFLFS